MWERKAVNVTIGAEETDVYNSVQWPRVGASNGKMMGVDHYSMDWRTTSDCWRVNVTSEMKGRGLALVVE